MKTKRNLAAILLSSALAVSFSSCDTNSDKAPANPTISTGVYVLNEGSFQKNNASLTYYNLTDSAVTGDIFTTKNNRGLGDTGQDILKYGSKIYIAVYESSLIEVINAATGISEKSIPMLNTSGQPASPRSLASYNGKIFISLYDGHVAQLDTTTLLIEKTVAVGSNPEGIVVANNKIYVANSGGMAIKNDSTISVIDPTTFTVIKNIKVVINPSMIKADAYGDLYVISFGNYSSIPYTLQRIQAATTEAVTVIPNLKPYNMTIAGDNLYLYSYAYDANWQATNKSYTIYDVKNEKVLKTDFISATAIASTPYSIDVNPVTSDIYIGETNYTNTGKMNVFRQDGTLKFSFATGVNPRKTIFLTK